ncbi:hypothetical protein MHBO_000351 [Bonamia ostreae]|uniref:Uncharacterized protein n=1 Tax=Bonamia ostreae TaxID=126728 RepID=A0ABV2AFB8_9EUKA
MVASNAAIVQTGRYIQQQKKFARIVQKTPSQIKKKAVAVNFVKFLETCPSDKYPIDSGTKCGKCLSTLYRDSFAKRCRKCENNAVPSENQLFCCYFCKN